MSDLALHAVPGCIARPVGQHSLVSAPTICASIINYFDLNFHFKTVAFRNLGKSNKNSFKIQFLSFVGFTNIIEKIF